jgi:3',5'-cyclic AMP phosphodiesterase CpdA
LAAWLTGCRPAAPPAQSSQPTPVAAPAPKPKLHFVAYGDSRSRPDKHRAVVAQIAKVAPEAVFHTGDLVGDGADLDLWRQAVAIVQPINTPKCPYYLGFGNHERGVVDLQQYFDLPAAPGRHYYSVLKANCLFLMLDTTTLRLPGKDEEQIAWLRDELAKHATNPGEHLFVILHHPPFAIGEYAPGDLTIRKRLHPLLVAARPAAVFCGHDHHYYRTVRDGVPYIVTAGGGAPLYDPKPALAQPGDKFVKSLHFVDCLVRGAKVDCRVIDDQGQELDRFNLGVRPAAKPAEQQR